MAGEVEAGNRGEVDGEFSGTLGVPAPPGDVVEGEGGALPAQLGLGRAERDAGSEQGGDIEGSGEIASGEPCGFPMAAETKTRQQALLAVDERAHGVGKLGEVEFGDDEAEAGGVGAGMVIAFEMNFAGAAAHAGNLQARVFEGHDGGETNRGGEVREGDFGALQFVASAPGDVLARRDGEVRFAAPSSGAAGVEQGDGGRAERVA